MEDAGLIIRLKDSKDERAFCLELTPAGTNAAKRALPQVQRANRKLLSRFDESELEVVARFLTTIIEETQKGDLI
jgi:DNA-binding MarR family transcriptional regulator